MLLKGTSTQPRPYRPQSRACALIMCPEHCPGLWGRRHGPSRIRRHMGEAGVGGMGRQLGRRHGGVGGIRCCVMSSLSWCTVSNVLSLSLTPPHGRKDAKTLITPPPPVSRTRRADWGFMGVVRQPLTAPRPMETRRLSTPPNAPTVPQVGSPFTRFSNTTHFEGLVPQCTRLR